jgi:hypothetical protein
LLVSSFGKNKDKNVCICAPLEAVDNIIGKNIGIREYVT